MGGNPLRRESFEWEVPTETGNLETGRYSARSAPRQRPLRTQSAPHSAPTRVPNVTILKYNLNVKYNHQCSLAVKSLHLSVYLSCNKGKELVRQRRRKIWMRAEDETK